MPNIEKRKLSELLERIAADLDIPDHLYEDAVLKYEDVGAWLAECPDLKKYAPEIYPQGSFRLGTVTHPFSDRDEYDIDLVCHLRLEKEETTQEKLKEMVGDRLKQRKDIEEILKPSRRCWCLDYPHQFHMDVLPAIPNNERPPTGILLTDTDLIRWQKSNPIAYADWFHERMIEVFKEKRASIAESIQASIEEVPDWQVKTTLQRAVQLLKHHRDIYFQHDQENKPVSIIITTLAARAYLNQADLYDALMDIVTKMADFIEYRNGKWWVQNPVDPDENFADKWNEKPARRLAFLEWLKRVQIDFTDAIQAHNLNESSNVLSASLGGSVVNKAASSLGLIAPSLTKYVVESIQVPALADFRHSQAPTWLERPAYKATIKGFVHRSLYDSKKLWNLTDRPVPKNVGLKFVVSTNTPKPYEVKWQVVNTGREAAAAGQLRGDFYSGTGDVRWESTSYAGTHWVEAFVIKDGVCVARSGRKYIKVRP